MEKENTTRKKSNKGIKNLIIFLVIAALLVGLPVLFLKYQAKKTGMSISQVLHRKTSRTNTTDTLSMGQLTKDSVGKKIDFLVPRAIGQAYKDHPLICNVTVADLDDDGLLDVIVCDARNNTVSWIRQFPAGVYTEKVLATGLIAPAHAQVIDFNKDGHKDIIVAVLGLLFPSNDNIGSIVILENDGKCNFKKHVIAEKIARVSDVRAGDLNGDGLMDLAVAQFGYDDGETRWIENLGNWKFKSHILQNLSGPINVELVDIDNDGDLDIISLVSQEWEEIYCFINDGKGNFQQKLLWGSNNEDFGSSGIYICDLNKDGKPDILYTNGDAFDYMPPRGKPWHGIQWLENKGNLNFEYHRICNFIGAYNVRPVDLNHDGKIDLVAVSAFNLWDNPQAQSIIWLENIGHEQFVKHDIANAPTHLITLEMGDFNNDGEIDFVTGGMHAYPPYDRMGRVTLWMNNGALSPIKK
jgi:FG-GAP-like repeat